MTDTPLRVVLQASGNDMTLPLRAWQHAKNLTAAVGECDIEIVVQSGAVASLIDGHPIARKIAAARSDLPRVSVLVCRNATRANEVDEAQLVAGFEPIPAGIARIAQRQSEGWAFVPVP